jgi:hypothetical protein
MTREEHTLKGYTARLDDLMRRIMRLVDHARKSDAELKILGAAKPKGLMDDVLRAAVVLAHATMEDFLRTLALWLLPSAPESFLDQVPLFGTSGRSDKFSLGRLAQFRGQSVDALLAMSVEKYLERSNFNSTTEISAFLENLGLRINDADKAKFFPGLAVLMERRHQIVHRADRVDAASDALGVLCPIDRDTVLQWTQNVLGFIATVVIVATEQYPFLIAEKADQETAKEAALLEKVRRLRGPRPASSTANAPAQVTQDPPVDPPTPAAPPPEVKF